MVHPRDDGTGVAIKASASSQSDLQHVTRSDEIEGRIYKTTEWTVSEDDDNVKREHSVMF